MPKFRFTGILHTVPIVAINGDPELGQFLFLKGDHNIMRLPKKLGYWVYTWGLEIQLYVSK